MSISVATTKLESFSLKYFGSRTIWSNLIQIFEKNITAEEGGKKGGRKKDVEEGEGRSVGTFNFKQI